MKINLIWTVALYLLAVRPAYSQDTLTVQQAIAHAISKNYDVLIQQNEADKAENLAHPGQAGLLPEISLNGSAGYGIQNTRLEIANQPDAIENTGAQLLNYSAAVNLNYMVFSGFANRYRFDRLKVNANLADISTRMQVENTVLQVVTAYYNALRTQLNMAALQESLVLSKENLNYARERQNLSGGSRLSTLNAEVNFQRDSVNFLDAQNIHRQAMIMLNLVMGEEDIAQIHLLSADENALAVYSNYAEVEKMAIEQNAGIQAVRQEMQMSMLDLRIAKAAYSPTLSLQSSYSVNVTENEGSFILLNQSSGFSGGVNLSFPVFAGNKRIKNQQNAELTLANSELKQEDIQRNVRATVLIAWDTYQTSLQSVEIEKQALATAAQNLELSEIQFRNGQINSTQLREAQVNLTISRNSYNNAIYNLRLAEAELLRLSGQLLQ